MEKVQLRTEVFREKELENEEGKSDQVYKKIMKIVFKEKCSKIQNGL